MSGSPRIGVYPGTFDPITNGHLDIVVRATKVVDRLVVAVAENAGKRPLFDPAGRAALVSGEAASLEPALRDRIEVRRFANLLMDFAASMGAQCIIRGLRAVSDFEYEFQMAAMNARLNPNIETVFLMAAERQQFISSRFVKEIARLGGDISSFVSPAVAAAIARQFRNAAGGARNR